MEKKLYDAAVEGDARILRELIQEDGLILDKASLNCTDKTPLHIAALLGHVEFVRAILNVNSDTCLARDKDGRNPLHLAAMKGKLSVLQVLIHDRPLAAREKTGCGGTILHLCVKYNQLEALKLVVETMKDHEFMNARNDEGMTILHLAICDKQIETIKYLLQNNADLNAKNGNGNTALDMLQGGTDSDILPSLQEASPLTSKETAQKGTENDSHHNLSQAGEWLSRKRDTIMVVASLIATMAFQAGVNPAGGVWQDDLLVDSNGNPVPNPHRAGEAVMAYNHPKSFRYFLRANTIAFVSSLSTILLLISGLPFKNKLIMWGLMVIMWLTVTTIALTYGISIVIVTPKHDREQLSHIIEIAVIVWSGVMALLLLGNTIRLIRRWWIKTPREPRNDVKKIWELCFPRAKQRQPRCSNVLI